MPDYIRSLKTTSCLLILVASIPLTAVAAGGDDKPNIVLILMDNFGWG